MKTKSNEIAIHRLTALWAFTEAGLGGFLHAFKSPFTGLILGAIAMALITLICFHAKDVWTTLLKSLVIVLIIKMVISPHSMISAYIAVSFQGILGGLLYSIIGINTLSIFLLATMGMIESALQKVLVLTVLFGKSIWEAIDSLGNWIGNKFGIILPFDSSVLLISTYVLFYFLTGLAVAYIIASLITRFKELEVIETAILQPLTLANTQHKKRKKKRFLKTSFVLLSAALLISFTLISIKDSNWSIGIFIVIRTVVILILWYGILAPLFLKFIKQYLTRKNTLLSNEVNQIMDIFPYLSQIVRQTWQSKAHLPFLKRIKEFLFATLIFTMHFKIPKP